jgi:hypothetical protein
MNQKFLTLKTLRRVLRSLGEGESSARFTETERSRAAFTIMPIILSLLLVSPCFAWDDDDDTDSKPFQHSNYNQQNSSIDYGYKNPYQANSTHRASAIDLGGPKRLAQANDDNESKPFYQSNIQNKESKINYASPQQAYEDNDSKPFSQSRIQHQESRITLPTIEESVALRDQTSKEMMAESQRSFDRQEAQQEKSRAQMAKQQKIYDEMDREEGEMAEFLGGVYKAKFGATTGHNSAITSDGYVFRSGNNFVTPKGIYTKTGNTYAGPGSFTTQTGTLFFGNESTTIQAGGAYFSEGKSGFIVSPNTSTWRTR